LSEAELEALILEHDSNDARYVLGKLSLDGSSDKVKKNEKKGLQWLKEAIKTNHLGAVEYKCYWDIRFDKHPKLEKILATL
jgi:TPR repeat protein